MDLDAVRKDAAVAGAAAASAVAVSMLLRFVFDADASFLLRLSPIAVYFVYLFAHTKLPASVDTTRNWILLTAVVGAVVLLLAVY